MDNINLKYVIEIDSTLLSALKKMDEEDIKLLLVFDQSDFKGLLSIGDIQRAILKEKSLDSLIVECYRKNIRALTEEDSIEDIKYFMLKYRTEFMPIIDSDRKLVRIIFWKDIFGEDQLEIEEKIDLPVVIMAGGKGTRLRPITHVIPKPLIPLNNKTMLEHIIDSFLKVGCSKFFITTHYKAKLIQYYLEEIGKYNVTYINEKTPLGTAGSLHLLKGKIKKTFFVSNCDILINDDYSKIYNYHKENGNDLTIVGALKNYLIPYGIIKTGKNGRLVEIKEKPDITYTINSGMYVLEPHVLDLIPENEPFDITDLLESIRSKNTKVGVFPVSEKSWKDIGQWNEYLKYHKI